MPIDKEYDVSDEVKEVALKVLKNDREKIAADYDQLNIIYMKVFPNISKTTAGLCIKSGKLLKYFSEADVIIQVSGELWDQLNEETRYTLMLHEMKHVGIGYKKNGRMVIYLNSHDVQDFSDIITKYGINWIENIKSITASINDFQNGEEDKVRI